MYTVIIQKKARKQYNTLMEQDRVRVVRALQSLREDPLHGKKLEGDLDGYYAIRVWPYRVVYTIEQKIVTVTVVAIGHRKDVYRKM